MTTILHVDRRNVAGSLPLVCLHGWGMNLRVFDGLRDALAAERTTWALDLPGHGRSSWNVARADFDAQVEDVLAVLPAHCVLLGWSFGAKLALELAARAPARIHALVLVSATPKFARSGDWPHGLDAKSMQAFRAVLEQDWQQTLRDFVWLQMRGSRNAEAAQRALEAALAAHGAPQPGALQRGLDLLSDVDLRERVSGIAQPALIVSGQNDRVTPAGAARWLASTLPRSRVVEIARAGHAPFASHAAEFNAAVCEFLAALPEDAA